MPSSVAGTLTGGGTSSERERPWGRSGWLTTRMTSNPSPNSAKSEGTAYSGVPKNAMRTSVLESGRGNLLEETFLTLAQPPPFVEQQPPLERAQMINEQHAVQVIDLMLDGAGAEVGGLHLGPGAVQGGGLHHDPQGAFDVPVELRDREAAFLLGRGARALQDHGVDQRPRRGGRGGGPPRPPPGHAPPISGPAPSFF